MKIREYIEEYQPLLSRTFSRTLKEGKLAHAYLLSGEVGAPLKEIAFYLAKSILCEHGDPLADETCRTCTRIENGNYADLLFYDGEEESIKKEDVSEVIENFTQTPIEAKGIMVYIINMVEAMTGKAANALLKFLEEPSPNTYAILTTTNESKILPTILSRCQQIRLLLSPRKDVIDHTVNMGVPKEDAEILSYFNNAPELVIEEANSEEFKEAKKAFEAALYSLLDGQQRAYFVFENQVLPAVAPSREKAPLRFFFDLLTLAFEDMVAYRNGYPMRLSSYATIIGDLSNKLPSAEESLLQIMTLRRQIELNINPGLLLTHLVSVIYKV